MQLNTFKVSGLRCLANTREIPVKSPTILTGPNDGGKSSALKALAFLLGEGNFADHDRTNARVDDEDVPGGVDNEAMRFNEIQVTGRFGLTPQEMRELDSGQELILRRVWRSKKSVYEQQTMACKDPAFRDLETQSVATLKALAEEMTYLLMRSRLKMRTYLPYVSTLRH